jgi:pimeloyl-ACP methyl ester carboxylesterase
MPFVEQSGVRLFYTIDGVGPPMLLVHGLGADSDDWVWHIPAFSDGYQVVAVDLRGHGHSGVPARGYTVREYVTDLVALLDAAALDRVIGVGHSFGGLLVAALAIEHPERVAALVEVDPAYGVDPAWPAAFVAIAKTIEDRGSEALLAAMESFWVPSTPVNLRCWHRRRVLGTAPLALAESMREWADADGVVACDEGRAYLRRRTCPVLACYADPDRINWEASTLTASASRAVGFPGAGHWLFQEQPEAFTRTVMDWLATVT